MSIPEWQQIQEAEFFNWKCLICNILAKSPLHLENQFLVEHGIYVNIDGTEWIKCLKCLTPYHTNCTKDGPHIGPYICSFLAFKKIKL